jgi:pimeloyl-ACP methyl ester carboxylesterase
MNVMTASESYALAMLPRSRSSIGDGASSRWYRATHSRSCAGCRATTAPSSRASTSSGLSRSGNPAQPFPTCGPAAISFCDSPAGLRSNASCRLLMPSSRSASTRLTPPLTVRLRQHSALGMSNTMARCQALRPSLHDLRDQFSEMTVPVLLAVGDEDVRCLETNLMLKSALSNAGLWTCPNTGHAINLEEPTAFNAQIENFLGAVERGSWRRGFPGTEVAPHLGWCRCAYRDNSPIQADPETADAGVVCLHH